VVVVKIETLDLWYKENDIHNFLHKHDLTRESLIVDIGSYKGKWLYHMNQLYSCKCIGVEPITEYATESSTLAFNNECLINNFGLTVGVDKKVRMSFEEDASSILKESSSKNSLEVQVVNAKHFFNKIINNIDVLQINAEGLEYELIPYMIKNYLLNNVKHIQIQFHDIDLNSEHNMDECIDLLEQNGFITKFNYPFVWYAGIKR
jgi:FkbM family methyltransferase